MHTHLWACLALYFWILPTSGYVYITLIYCISKGHKHSGLFCTKLQVLFFLTLVIFTSKTWNFIDFNKIHLQSSPKQVYL